MIILSFLYLILVYLMKVNLETSRAHYVISTSIFFIQLLTVHVQIQIRCHNYKQRRGQYYQTDEYTVNQTDDVGHLHNCIALQIPIILQRLKHGQ